jgi:inhibitor of the pro-sigma K processing machinery
MLVIAFGLGLVLLYLSGWLLMSPMKWLLKGILWALLGAVALVAVNWAGAPLGIRIAVNPLTALTAGALGVPGVAMLLLLDGIL